MIIKTINFKKPITNSNVKASINYHFRRLQKLQTKGNKFCYFSVYTIIFCNKLKLFNTVNSVVINIFDNKEVKAYCALIIGKCITNQECSKTKPNKIVLYFNKTNKQKY